ncbi:MAG: UDP-N-acetylmuramoyl-L-alanyl-D-glutamate--2,6-diaminopimelate ligase [Patescibacteria group bacterium]
MDKILGWFKKFIPLFVFNPAQPLYHWFLANFAAFWHGRPSRDMVVIGVTGTNGKTSVVEFIFHILTAAGLKAASISSVYFRIGEEAKKNNLKMTMPGRFFMQKFLRRARNKGATYAVLEITSEGIKQFRHKNIDWDILVLTNIAPEHIEAHGSFENYRRAKEKVFAGFFKTFRKPDVAKTIIVNADDPSTDQFLKYPADKKISYRPSLIFKKETASGIEFEYRGRAFKTKLIGDFNLANLLAAVVACESLGISDAVSKAAVESIAGVPGRMEFIQRRPFAAVVDYAHTPDALFKVYETLKSYLVPEQALYGAGKLQANKLICVLGSAGGGRDKWKRPEMGKIAARYCDEIILTNEDPYDEDPDAIICEIESGIGNDESKNLRKISDRKEAIRQAISAAGAGDIVIITGKGSEPWMMGPNGQKIAWDDRQIAREAISKAVEMGYNKPIV